MRSLVVFCFGALIWLATVPAVANDPLEAFRRGLEDGAKLLQGQRSPGQQSSPLEEHQRRILELQASGELEAALPLAEQQLRAVEAAFGSDSLEYSATLGIKAGILQDLGQYEAAIDLYREAARVTVAAVGRNNRYYARDLINLADLLRVTGLLDEAHALFEQAVTITRRHEDAGYLETRSAALIGLGEVRRMLGRDTNAKAALAEAIKSAQALPVARPDLIAVAISNLSLIQAAEGNAQTALDNIDKLMPFIRGTALDRTSIGLLLRGQRAFLFSLLGRHDEAAAAARDGVALARRRFQANNSLQAKAEAALGVVLARGGKHESARPHLIAAIAKLMRPEQRIADLVAPQFEEDRFRGLYLSALADTSVRLNDARARRLLFQALGQVQTTAADRALRQTSFRSASGDLQQGSLVRRLQDIEAQLTAKRYSLFRLELGERDRQSRLEDEIAQLTTEHEAALQQLASANPLSGHLIAEASAPLEKTQAQLSGNEALVWLIEFPQPFALFPETYVWVVTRETERLVAVDMRSEELAREVRALRCGLDRTSWTDPSPWASATDAQRQRRDDQAARREVCIALTGKTVTGNDLLPFDAGRAYQLYKALFGKVDNLIAGKSLIVVLSKTLSSLPLHVLLAKPPAEDAAELEAPWLGIQQSITVLPAVSSLLALRRDARESRASEPYLGFGDPVLDGGPDCLKLQAPDSCPQISGPAPIASLGARQVAALRPLSSYFRSGQADAEAVRKLCPLPETAQEIRCIAESLGAPAAANVVLGPAMTETGVKRAPLSRYRILHFATHGLLSGEMARLAYGKSEPALVFTPPRVSTGGDDGLLTASEIAALKLDADWVVLSACNTAAADGQSADALSGLARAFFYAGARALLVSHWQVDSYAATMLTSTVFAELRADPTIPRAEALRRAMKALITGRNRKWAAHPAVWAPFVVVGEGAAEGRQ